MVKIPVVIGAFNEAPCIHRPLEALPPEIYDPIIADNGSTDDTVAIAERYGATVFQFEEQGKLPALQGVLRQLGDRAMEPILFLDADSFPESARWGQAMTAGLDAMRPGVVCGLTGFWGGNPIADRIRSYRRIAEANRASEMNDLSAFTGANMGVRLHNPAILEEILEMPHIWPGEDRAIADLILRHGGNLRYALEQDAKVRVSSRFYPSLTSRLLHGASGAIQDRIDDYNKRAAPGVTHWFDVELHKVIDNEA